ncbi:hypothetical protein H5410_055800 [Solanum commersonii]|uniref:Uncharacterized protein n=1 Tax=Solanum commersonii TaxID=4109 RepID=A0A9J5WJE2_SOLCO|nr:hypothetical protein H5410_055800 [Solanum commersonii]
MREIIRFEGIRVACAARDQRSLYNIKFDDLVEDLPQESEDQYRNTSLQVVSTLSCDLGNVMKMEMLIMMKVSDFLVILKKSQNLFPAITNRWIDDFSSDDDPPSILRSYRMLRKKMFTAGEPILAIGCKQIRTDEDEDGNANEKRRIHEEEEAGQKELNQHNGNQESHKKVEETEDGKTEGFDEGEA